MFYFDNISGYKVLKSDLINEVLAFFTTREVESVDSLSLSVPIIRPQQTHSSNVEIVYGESDYPDTDGLIINEKNFAICLKFADCTPLIFYDTEHQVGAISHAGWRGTVSKIAVKTVEKMGVKFNTKPKDVKVLIGPAISSCCYEVGEDVKNKLLSTVNNTENLCNGNFVDLKGINAQQLREIGVSQIDIAPYCTCCDNNLFYSYRKENGTEKRHYAILKL